MQQTLLVWSFSGFAMLRLVKTNSFFRLKREKSVEKLFCSIVPKNTWYNTIDSENFREAIVGLSSLIGIFCEVVKVHESVSTYNSK